MIKQGKPIFKMICMLIILNILLLIYTRSNYAIYLGVKYFVTPTVVDMFFSLSVIVLYINILTKAVTEYFKVHLFMKYRIGSSGYYKFIAKRLLEYIVIIFLLNIVIDFCLFQKIYLMGNVVTLLLSLLCIPVFLTDAVKQNNVIISVILMFICRIILSVLLPMPY